MPEDRSDPSTRSVSLPHLYSDHGNQQLIVDDAPYLILGGEVGNSAAAGPEALDAVWPTVDALHLNTVLAPVYWELTERVEGQFDFRSVDQLIAQAREHRKRLVLLWFGVYKNSMSTYVPEWVKHDPIRFPLAQDKDGVRLNILSPFAVETVQADCRAFAALMRHLKETDGSNHTVVMVQVENEIGMLPDARDHSPAADGAFAAPVPAALLDAVRASVPSRFAAARLYHARSILTSGDWETIFGSEAAGEEVFTAWAYARLVDQLAQAGKAEYRLPMYVNCALNRPGRLPGQYPAGGPLPHLLDVWRAGAPHLDMLSPDVYFYDFADWAGRYHVPGNPLFVPETFRDGRTAANTLQAFGGLNAIGFSPFAIESVDDPARSLLGQVYGLLGQLMLEIVNAQKAGTIRALSPIVHADGTMDHRTNGRNRRVHLAGRV